jgi:hypothetical protein
VDAGVATTVTVAPTVDTLSPGAERNFFAQAFRQSGAPIPGAAFVWTSLAENVATVNATGRVFALSVGETDIVATAPGGIQQSARLVVRAPVQAAAWDIDLLGVPHFVTADYIASELFTRISYFRSNHGHDYSDEREQCRSMKHYYDIAQVVGPDDVAIYAPVTGEVVRVQAEQSFGTQLQIRPDAQPAFTVIIFHVLLDAPILEGDRVVSGTRIGRHIGAQTSSDVAIRVQTPTESRLVSYFDALSEPVWAKYSARGITSRGEFAISRAARDADPLTCDTSGGFVALGALPRWVVLQ